MLKKFGNYSSNKKKKKIETKNSIKLLFPIYAQIANSIPIWILLHNEEDDRTFHSNRLGN